MKKIFAVILVLAIILGINTLSFAQTHTNNEMGISFIISDDWEWYKNEANEIIYKRKWTDHEHFAVTATEAEGAYDIDLYEEIYWRNICTGMFSDDALARELNSANRTNAFTVKSNSVQVAYEYYGGTKYFRYEKAYTASAKGFYNQGFYMTALFTAKNGKIYCFKYTRDNETNHYSEFDEMLRSVSYAEGEISIYVNGEKVFPDNPPMLIEGRTMVPIRAVAEKMGYSVQWDEASYMVRLTSQDGANTLYFLLGSQSAYKNQEKINLDVAPFMYQYRTYLPVRAVAEGMNADVQWNDAERAVYITEK